MKKLMIFVFVFFVTAGYCFAVEHMLPYPGGSTWMCSQGNYNDDGNIWGWWNSVTYESCVQGEPNCEEQWSNPTHRVNTNMAYAWDFNFTNNDPNDLNHRDDDLGLPVLATANGTIVFVGIGYNSKQEDVIGNTVIINFGNGEYGKYCHLLNKNVNVGKGVRSLIIRFLSYVIWLK